MKTKLISVFILSLLFTNCKKEDSNPVIKNDPNNTIMNLTIGNDWTYEIVMYDTSGIAYITDTISFSILRDTIIQTEKWYLLGNSSIALEILTIKNDGLWYSFFDPSGNAFVPKSLHAKYPCNVNDTWLRGDSTRVTVLTKDTLISIYGKSYSCYSYGYQNPKSNIVDMIIYFSPNNGIVKMDNFGKTNSGRIFTEIKRNIVKRNFSKISHKDYFKQQYFFK
jgi:hypothetical protein